MSSVVFCPNAISTPIAVIPFNFKVDTNRPQGSRGQRERIRKNNLYQTFREMVSAVDQQRPLAILLSDLVGSINSQVAPASPCEKTVFDEAIACKLAKQGICRP